jgi:uncharacterized protein YyaL (SSP411 family)
MTDSDNRLRHETSPYLLQHADNPVNWRPWGVAALAEAQAEGKPILLSIGYAACHWCHVMAHESFEDPATAAAMNADFVNIKVDREERPDIDALYMAALHALGEQGGWPMTMFLTSDGAPFWGGTYFPPEPRWGRPSFRQVLAGIAGAWREGHELVSKNSNALRRALAAQSLPRPGDPPGPEDLSRAAAALQRLTDPVQGGLRGAPKFPNPPIFRFLWQDAFRTGGREGIDATHLLLRRMSAGGIHDHLGGGFARYATDDVWLVPHFEKMLYDNAQLLELLALAHAEAPDPLYAEVADGIVAWLLRDMRALVPPDSAMPARFDADATVDTGSFAASEDADSEGVEGKFYVWDAAEVAAILGDSAPLFARAYDVTQAGNWEGHVILRRVTPRGSDAEEAALAAARETLRAVRARRVRPGRDDKVLADWNALMIAALCRAAAVFDRPAWSAVAGHAADFVLARLGSADGRVQHAWRLDRVTAAGLLEDQATLARACLALYETTGDARRLAQTIRLARAAQAHFADGTGGFFSTADDATDVPLGAEARPRAAADGATPSGAGMLAEAFARLFHLTGDASWREAADGVLRAHAGQPDQAAGVPTLLAAADLLEAGASVVVAGPADHPLARALAAVVLASPDPAVTLLRAESPEGIPEGHPAAGKRAGAAGAAAYVCRANVCGRPIEDPAALARELRTRGRA